MNVMERDAEGSFLWMVASDIVPLIEDTKAKPESRIRTIERWCASNVLSPYVRKATNEEILALLEAGRIRGFPQKDRGVYLIHRDGLPLFIHRPKKGRRPKESLAGRCVRSP